MNYKNKRRLGIIRDYCIGWTLAFIFLSIIRGVGTVELGSVQFDFWLSILYCFILGPFFGAISGYAQILTEERIYRQMSIQRLILFRAIYALAFLLFMVWVSYGLCKYFLDIKIGFIEFAFEPGSFAIYFYILFIDAMMTIIRQVNLMLGDRKLGQLIFGKYYALREEERIFMFLDLQSSTTLAEQLGHVKYSLMIQDCFNDLAVVSEYEAGVYQYVGDEAVLTWRIKAGLSKQNCIKAFFSFRKKLKDRASYYMKEYGVEPFFKAGMNVGLVTATEVGKYKREIAYHGDAINTAARIQGMCNQLEEEFLISSHLKEKLDLKGLILSKKGSIPLKGKAQEVEIFAVSLSHEMAEI